MGWIPDINDHGNFLRDSWDRLSPWPGGRRLYSRMLGWFAPYTATIEFKVEELSPGYARVGMKDTRKVRNHLKSVHAIALLNLAEIAGNLALGYSLPEDARFIPVGIEIEYLTKARGPITGESQCPIPTTADEKDYEVPVSLRNRNGVEVARATLKTRVGPKKPVS